MGDDAFDAAGADGVANGLMTPMGRTMMSNQSSATATLRASGCKCHNPQAIGAQSTAANSSGRYLPDSACWMAVTTSSRQLTTSVISTAFKAGDATLFMT